MKKSDNRMDANSHLILHRTARKDIKAGIPIISRGEGAYVFDEEGNRYLDLDAGVTRPVHVGYGRRDLAQAAYDQMCRLAYYTPCQFTTRPPMDLAAKLAAITPAPINRFLFECDGSEAVESAMKIAKHYHHYQGDKGRFKIISRRGAYHGVNGIGVRALGTVMPMRQIMEPLAPGGIFVDSPYCYRCPVNLTYPDCDIACARNVEQVIEFENPEQISALIGEPIQQGFGALAPPREYWPIIREICDRYGILLIIDEVICGFGRTGKMFAIEHFQIAPDLMTMAKGITSGYVPLGAVGCTDKVMAPIDILMHLHTYGNHPVACAAALKNLDIIIGEELVENSRKMGEYFLEGLKTLESIAIVGEARGTGLWTALDFTTAKKTRALFPLDRLNKIIAEAKRKGFIIKTMGHALEFAPPLIIRKEQIDATIDMLAEIISAEAKDMGC
ncbi:MAG: aspartate aminotransferase family protein [Desulfobacterales bacterium]|nr:MAG: aspartate aminotransferase family protein [Desulfobacterales bacterium]